MSSSSKYIFFGSILILLTIVGNPMILFVQSVIGFKYQYFLSTHEITNYGTFSAPVGQKPFPKGLLVDEYHKDYCRVETLLTEDEKYLIYFNKKLRIIELNTMKTYETAISGHGGVSGVPFSMQNINKSELLSFGFIRECWKLPQYNDMTSITDDGIIFIKLMDPDGS